MARSLCDQRVIVLSDGKRRGLAARLNEIARYSRGEFLARMDGDDVMHPDRLAQQLDYLQRNDSVSVIGSGLYVIDQESVPWGKAGVGDLIESSCQRDGLLSNPGFPHGCMMARTEWFRKNQYDEHLLSSQDQDLWCRVIGKYTLARLGSPLYFYRVGRSLSVKGYIGRTQTRLQVAMRHGPAQVGYFRTALTCGNAMLKALVVTAAISGGLDQMLVNRRFEPLSPREREEALSVLARVQAVDLPSTKIAAASGHK